MRGFVTKKAFLAALLPPAILMVVGAAQAAGNYEQAVLADNPVAYWRLNESSGPTAFNRASAAYPDPSNPLNGTYNGGVTLGIAGAIVGDAAAAFNPGQYMSVPNQPALNVTEVSVEAWINPANIPPQIGNLGDPIASIVTKGDFAYRLQLDGRTNPAWQVALGLTSLDSTGQQSNFIDLYGPVPSPNVWTHVVGTYDGSTARLYVNGILVNSASYTTGLGIDSYPLAIGENLQEERMGRFFNGGIDEVALYAYPLSAEQVAAHYTAGATVNHFVAFEPIPSTYRFTTDATGCPVGFVGIFSFDATLTNSSDRNLTNLQVAVAELTDGNLLLTEEGLLGEGERFSVPRMDGFADAQLSQGELVNVPFAVCLQERQPFRLFVDVLGTVLTSVPVEISKKSTPDSH